MTEESFQDRINKQTRKEFEEANSDWARRQKELDFWWEHRFAEPPKVLTDYSPVDRYDAEADYKQQQADRAYSRSWR
jgi:hypothetical protein